MRSTLQFLEVRLQQYLGLPPHEERDSLSPAHPEDRASALAVRLRQLRPAVVELEQMASGVGRIPAGYPVHVHLVMRAVAALLPWYTRPLAQFARRSQEVSRATLEILDEIAREQRRLGEEIDHLQRNPPERRPGPAGAALQ